MVENFWEQLIIGLSIKITLMSVIVVRVEYSSGTYNMLSSYLINHASYQTWYNNPSLFIVINMYI